jgi:hypothetical protein
MAKTKDDLATAEIEQVAPPAPPAAEGAPPQGTEPLTAEGEQRRAPLPVLRLSIAASAATLAAAIMVGGVFNGVSPRIWAAISGILGVVAAARVRTIKNAILMNVAIFGAIFVIGIIMCIPAGNLNDIVNLGPFISDAISSGDVQRPPVDLTLGWRAILGWLMGGIGFAAAWIGMELRRPALGLIIPLPIVAIAAISVPNEARVGSGIGSLVLFALGLGLLSGIDLEGEGDQKRSFAFELRRARRARPPDARRADRRPHLPVAGGLPVPQAAVRPDPVGTAAEGDPSVGGSGPGAVPSRELGHRAVAHGKP